MTNITLEMIDEVLRRKKVSYAEAKEALEQTDGNVVEALVFLDRKPAASAVSPAFESVKKFIKDLHEHKVSFEKESDVLVKLPGTIMAALFICFFPFTLILSFVLIILGYKVKIRKAGQAIPLDAQLDKLQDDIQKITK